jgi:hypothetical protein
MVASLMFIVAVPLPSCLVVLVGSTPPNAILNPSAPPPSCCDDPRDRLAVRRADVKVCRDWMFPGVCAPGRVFTVADLGEYLNIELKPRILSLQA